MIFKLLFPLLCVCLTSDLINAHVIKIKPRDFNDEQYKNIQEQLDQIANWAQLFTDELPVIFQNASDPIKEMLVNQLIAIDALVVYIEDTVKTNYGEEGLKCVDPEKANFTAIKDELETSVSDYIANQEELVSGLINDTNRLLTSTKDKAYQLQSEWKSCGDDEKCRFEVIVDGNESSETLRQQLLVLDAAVTHFKDVDLKALQDYAEAKTFDAAVGLRTCFNSIYDCLMN